MKVGIGIVCIGKQYSDEFEATFKPSVVAYASKHGYDIRIFDAYLDPTHAHPDCISFQKCLVPAQMTEYDVVMVLDADIWLTDKTPPVHAMELSSKIGIVNEVAQLPPQQYAALGFASQPTEYYAMAGFALNTTHILNTGLMVCRPALHAQFLRGVYGAHIDKAIGHPRRFHYEQACIGYELQTQSMFTTIPNEWNWIYIFGASTQVYGMHFAGLQGSSRAVHLRKYLTTHLVQSRVRWGIRK